MNPEVYFHFQFVLAVTVLCVLVGCGVSQGQQQREESPEGSESRTSLPWFLHTDISQSVKHLIIDHVDIGRLTRAMSK